MLYQTLLALCVAPICLCSIFGVDTNARYATFYDRTYTNYSDSQMKPLMTGDDCNIGDKEGIRQSDRLSFWPGYKATDGGDYCGDCVTIDGARRIHTNWYEEVDCETTMVWNHTSFHFEKAKKASGASSANQDRSL
jgi:hypothetical protein